MSDLCVFSTGVKPLLRRSCEDHGIELHEYGAGRPWPGMCIGKITEAREFLQSRSEKYAMFSDGEDSFLVNTAPSARPLDQEIISRFLLEGPADGVLLSGEKNCWPDSGLADKFPTDDGPWRFVNAGGWMGKRDRLIAALESMESMASFRDSDDQACWTTWYLLEQDRRALDSACEIFQTMNGTTEIAANGENLLTGSYPIVYHYNGRCGLNGRMEADYERLTA